MAVTQKHWRAAVTDNVFKERPDGVEILRGTLDPTTLSLSRPTRDLDHGNNQSARVLCRERVECEVLVDAKHHGACGHAKGKSDHGNRGKPRILAEHAEGEAP